MQVVIPTAGFGKRLRPLTLTTAKVMLNVAGKPMIAHILDKIKVLNPSEVIFITGYLGQQIEDYVHNNFTFKTRFIEQKALKGSAHAISLAEPYVKEDCLILFGDTLFEGRLELGAKNLDGVIGVCPTDTPERFGIVEQKRYITRLVEKPEKPKSNLALIGIYYIKNQGLLFECINELMEKGVQTKGEYQLTDALQMMIDKGAKLKTFTVEKWLDCGKFETWLETNKELLHGKSFIAPGATVEGSKIEYSVIDNGCKIKNSRIVNSIVHENSVIEDSCLMDSVIGKEVQVSGCDGRLILGDYGIVSGKAKRPLVVG